MTGIRTYWIFALVGITLCAAGLSHGFRDSEPAIANRYGVVAVAMTFAMLFFSRGTAVRILDAPVHFPTSPVRFSARLDETISKLRAVKSADPDAVSAVVDCLAEMNGAAEIRRVCGETQKADELEALIASAIKGLSGAKRIAVENSFNARKALAEG